ncbi:MAG: trypsin-like peptidase domain-containing protein, partial [Pararhizobium sp.]
MYRNSEQASSRRARSMRALFGVAVLSSALVFAGAASADPVSVDAPKVPSFADVVEAVSPAVVSVRARNSGVGGEAVGSTAGEGSRGSGAMSRLLDAFKAGGSAAGGSGPGNGPSARPVAQGSGFFVSSDGYVVTNAHLVDEADGFSVILDDGSELDARLIGADSRTDIALLKVEKPGRTFTSVGFAPDDSVRIGDWVVSVGNPYGLGGTVTAGIVSARGRDLGAGPYDDFIQVDSVVNRGDPGGPAFNLGGKVIGVDTTVF